jgi:hypothetical protein
MRQITVQLTGASPLLMHSISLQTMEQMMKKVKKGGTGSIPSPEDEAEQGAYRMKSGELCIPARCIKACLVNASTWYKMGKKSAKQFIAGSVTIEPYEVGLGTKKYEIDLRTVVIQGKSRIVRARPRLDNWSVTFNIIYNDKVMESEIIKQIMEEAGYRIGLLDNRPQRGGECGCFKVTGWKETEVKPIPISRTRA